MTNLINTKIILSGATILAAVALIIGATFAFFSDSETSIGNIFATGELDLQIDAEAHYAGLTCDGSVWDEDVPDQSTRPDLIGDDCDGTWALTDLDETHKFFNLTDIKPGDTGENTISIHVFDNDAWVYFEVNPTSTPNALQNALLFNVWLDQGGTPGFQGQINDPTEGDNIRQPVTEPLLASPGTIDVGGEAYVLGPILAAVRSSIDAASDVCDDSDTGSDPDGDGVTDGNVGACQGLPIDGHLVGSTTYYFGVGWELPSSTGNEAQALSFVADMIFQAVQYRNNPSPVFPLPTPTP
ncbi:MAG: hypothetical protein HYW63_03390 [Candidatus Levybacteria bacterium]|nr:hypothetical protein [Candidatus Levybacteria bacterium]